MKDEDYDWIVYLDDTIRVLSKVSESSPVGVAVDGVLPRIDIGYNEEFSIKNESKDVLYFVRGVGGHVEEIPPAPVSVMCYDTIGAPDVSIYIRKHRVNTKTPKLNNNSATRYGLDSRKLISHPIYIPELGGFLCALSQLSRTKNYCRTRYQPIAPDASCPVWIHAHMSNTTLTHLYASVNNRIVKVKIHRGDTDHARDRVIYYQWACSPDKEVRDVLDTVPAEYFVENSVWETKNGEYVSTTYDELKVLLERRGIDIDYIQTLKEELAKRDKENAFLKGQLNKLADPAIQDEFISEKRREKFVKTIKDTFDVIDRGTAATKAGQDIHDKYYASKRKRAEDSFFRIKQVLESGSGVMRILTSALSLLSGIMKLFG